MTLYIVLSIFIVLMIVALHFISPEFYKGAREWQTMIAALAGFFGVIATLENGQQQIEARQDHEETLRENESRRDSLANARMLAAEVGVLTEIVMFRATALDAIMRENSPADNEAATLLAQISLSSVQPLTKVFDQTDFKMLDAEVTQMTVKFYARTLEISSGAREAERRLPKINYHLGATNAKAEEMRMTLGDLVYRGEILMDVIQSKYTEVEIDRTYLNETKLTLGWPIASIEKSYNEYCRAGSAANLQTCNSVGHGRSN